MDSETVQLGPHRIPWSSLHSINLSYQDSVPRCVRVWFRSNGIGYGPPTALQPPAFLDFRGADAQAIRRNMRAMNSQNVLLEYTEATETETAPPKTRAAGK